MNQMTLRRVNLNEGSLGGFLEPRPSEERKEEGLRLDRWGRRREKKPIRRLF